MRKFLFITLALLVTYNIKAQTNDKSIATYLVTKNSDALGLSKSELNNYIVSSTYFNKSAGTQMVYLLQSYKALPVFNQMLVLAFKDEKLISNAGHFLKDMDNKTHFESPTPKLAATDGVRWALTEEKLPIPTSLVTVNISENGRKLNFGKSTISKEDIVAELMWVPVEEGKVTTVKLAWQVQVAPLHSDDYWNIRVDANTGKFINKNNYTDYDQFLNRTVNQAKLRQKPVSRTPSPVPGNSTVFSNSAFSPQLVNTVNYTVIPYPAESPIHPGGAASMRTNPWTLAGGNAASLGWHNDGTFDYTTSRGNNVHVHEDQANNNSNNGTMAVSTTTPDPLNFNFPPNYTVPPTTPNFQQFALTNLFYWNNILHDITYKYGFDEPAGNFQNNNQGRGGAGNDYVQADAQDGGGTNNANMSTPPDGGKPRMQMYLWSASTSFVVNTPAAIAGSYTSVEGAFSTANLLQNVGPVTGQVIYYNDDAAGTTHEACAAPANSITGKIALIKRGTCAFTVKVKNAQLAGAIAVIMVNNVPGAPITMGGTDNTITIPAVMISDVDGATIIAQLANNVNVTLSAGVQLDGDLDNGIITHEFFHGVSNRLTGGPATTSCLGNAEEGGEGWSDYNALMLTTDWSTAVASDGFNKPRPIGNYAIGQPITGGGIRNYPYCTNIAVNPLTYANMGTGVIGTEVHNIGEIWCMALWEMTWSIIQTDGINPNLFNNATPGGNSVAYKLVIEGLKLQPCSPGYIDARDAILQADQNLYGGAHYCAIWSAFAKRGMGYSASEGSPFSATDQTPATNLPPGPSISVQPVSVSVCAGVNTSFSVTATGAQLKYQWQVSTNSGATWTNITNGGVYTGTTTALLTLTGVTVALNGNQYRCVLNAGCILPTTVNSTAVTLTVASSAPVISSQPANTSICTGTNATISVAATGGTLTYQWQESTNGGTTWNTLANSGVYSGVTTSTLTLTAVPVSFNNNQYRVIITGGCNGTTVVNSTAAVLTVSASVTVTITTQPSSVSVCAGANATYTVAATGSALIYNWQVSSDGGITWTNLSPVVTTPTLTLTSVTAAMNNTLYRCQVTGTSTCSTGSVTSASAGLTVSTAPVITSQPSGVTICSGSNTSFAGSTTGTGLTYQWQLSATGCSGVFSNVTNGGIYAGALSSTLSITGATIAMNGYAYRLVVSGTCAPAATSNCATLSVIAPATVTAQPSGVAVCENSTATLTSAGGGTNPVYQWQFSTNNGTTWTNLSNTAPYSGTNSGTLVVNPVSIAMNGYQYRLQVNNATCPALASSNAAVLTVNALPNVATSALPASVCTGTTSVLTATGANSYSWSPAVTGSGASVTVTPLITTTYTVTGTNTATGCVNTASVTVIATPKPSLVLTAAPYTRLLPGLTTTITATATSATTNTFNYAWSYTGTGLAQQFSGNTHLVNLSGLGTYTVVAADASNQACASQPVSIIIGDSASNKLFIFPSPNNGLFTISYYNTTGASTKQTVAIYNSLGQLMYTNIFSVNQPYQLLNMDLRNYAPGVYYVTLKDATSGNVKTGKVIIR